jgi:hypothetical protein
MSGPIIRRRALRWLAQPAGLVIHKRDYRSNEIIQYKCIVLWITSLLTTYRPVGMFNSGQGLWLADTQ